MTNINCLVFKEPTAHNVTIERNNIQTMNEVKFERHDNQPNGETPKRRFVNNDRLVEKFDD